MLRTAGRAIVQCWPLLLIWFLAGYLGHGALIRLAGWAGNFDSLWGLLIVPLAVVVKLASYVLMFVSVRSALPHYQRLDALSRALPAGPETAPVADASLARSWVTTVISGLLPFLVIYIAWGMILDDLLAYGRASRDQFGAEGATDHPYAVSVGVMSVTFVVVAFALRFVLGRFAKRLPLWVGAISAYLEAAWVVTTVIAVKGLLEGVPEWFSTRRMFAWIVDGIAELRESFAWFAAIGDVLAWLLAAIGEVLVQPLAWLALAAVVFARALPRRERLTTGRAARVREAATRRWRRVPRPMRKLGESLSGSFRERWDPIATALSLVWRTGPVQLGTYVLAFALVTSGSEWLYRLVYTLLGPHEIGWWRAMSDPIVLGISAVVIPLQIVIVSAAFDQSLARLDEQVVSADAELAEVLTES